MNLGAILAMLMQSGVCAPVDLPRADGMVSRIIVCPALMRANTALPADDPRRAPKDCGEVAFDSREGDRLTVGVCATSGPAPAADPDASEPDSTPPLPGQKKT